MPLHDARTAVGSRPVDVCNLTSGLWRNVLGLASRVYIVEARTVQPSCRLGVDRQKLGRGWKQC